MEKDTVITVRIPSVLKQRVVARARREHRSLSSQIQYELVRLFGNEPVRERKGSSKILGRYREKGPLPAYETFKKVRTELTRDIQRRMARYG